MVELVWTKKLSKTDAQQKTSGGIVPYLRLTRSSLKAVDFQSWFRDTFFDVTNWKADTFGRETDIESCCVDMAISINGVKFGKKPFKITHGPNRHLQNNTPNTWLHWPDELQDVLRENNTTGWPVTMKRRGDGSFSLKIQAAKA